MTWRPREMIPQYLHSLAVVRTLIAKAQREGNKRDLPILASMERDLEWTVAYMATGDGSIYGRYRRCIPIDPQKLAKWVRNSQLCSPIHNRNKAREDVLAVADDLSPRECEAYIMHVGEGLSYGAMGELLGVGRFTAREHVRRAKTKIAAACPTPCTNK